jgi:hypothetical protein
MADPPPIPPAPPTGRIKIVDEEGRATHEFALWLGKLMHWLGHLPPEDPALPARSTKTLADWLRANTP